MRILLVEDESDLRQIIKKRLIKEKYTVDDCQDGLEAEDYIDMTEYDGIILDGMLPGKDGLDILKEMRRKGNHTPVLMLTARDSIEDRVKGLDYGADDYLVKPFSFEELLARLRAVMRRKPVFVSEVLTVDDLQMNLHTKDVMRNGERIELSSKEYMLLEYLMQNKNIVLSREQIQERVWGYDFEGGSNVVDVYIRYLRKKIDHENEKKLIQTVRGVGYVIRG
ncbi:MAG: response regulator transcription factor [Anaerostipes sp.]|uniref:two-component system response regulator RppA n=1 Tax=Anaerostipes sp. 992a TaxID=1261637 RepID=UPI0009528D4C|nr:two-component system response regulator RppA [Anaerostipes sp. 992a]MCI5952921.1 response regulator transcription factor [Anaerostipes sp.]OLR63758.1 DNA-binding response regulator [Anaerostipes sp. 992a]